MSAIRLITTIPKKIVKTKSHTWSHEYSDLSKPTKRVVPFLLRGFVYDCPQKQLKIRNSISFNRCGIKECKPMFAS